MNEKNIRSRQNAGCLKKRDKVFLQSVSFDQIIKRFFYNFNMINQ